MFDALIKLLPEWVLPVLFGLLIWFGANYLFIAPEIGRRTVENTCPASQRQLCQCVADHMISNARFPLALWTSSLSIYRVDRSTEILQARREGLELCQGS
jgi:hypothetical protein